MKEWDVAVIGAGASGMMAAITAARCGRSVVLLEKKERCGKKLLATGNGKCNFTNEDMGLTSFYGDRKLAEELLSQFSKEDTLSFFRGIGVYPKCKNGYYYPNSEQSSSVVTLLYAELMRLGVTVYESVTLLGAEAVAGGFCCRLKNENIRSQKLIFACGLLAAPKLGSDGSAFDVIKSFGHRFTPILPALCGCYCKGADFPTMAGVRTEAKVSVLIDGKCMAEDRGELQITDYGLSGIPVFQISRHASLGLYEGKNVTMCVDFFPDLTEEELLALVRELTGCTQRAGDGRSGEAIGKSMAGNAKDRAIASKSAVVSGNISEKLCGLCNRKIIMALMGKKTEVSEDNLQELVHKLKALIVTVEKMRDFEFAQVCMGGIRNDEIQKSTLESALVPGLYFCGELLNVDGICGGFNLQMAWSSGYVAGKSAAEA